MNKHCLSLSAFCLFLIITCAYGADTGKHDETLIIKPQDCDTFFNKKNRLYLHGFWSFKRVDGVPGYKLTDLGSKQKFWSRKFDDFSWEKRPVPEDINCDERPGRGGFKAGIGYLRRSFTVPPKYKGQRALLTFRRVSREPIVWINGKEVARPKNLSPDKISDVHVIDITNALKQKQSNQITVRFVIGENYRWTHGNGIWEPCWIEFVPKIYCKQMLVTPKLPDIIQVRCIIRNTYKSAKKIKLSANVFPWEGDSSYKKRLNKKSTLTQKGIGSYTIKSGNNRIKFSLKIKQPVLWDINDPFLYSLKLFNGKDRIGWERFGLREFTVQNRNFYLNGHRVFLYGTGHESWGPIVACISNRADASNNRNGFLRRFLEMLRKININSIMRLERIPPQIFLDLCDEIGIMQLPTPDVLVEMHYSEYAKKLLKKNRALFLKKAFRRNTLDAYNHPSIVAYMPEGEGNRVRGVMPRFKAYKELLRTYDPTRLISSAQSNCQSGTTDNGKRVYFKNGIPFDFFCDAALIGSHTGTECHTLIPAILRYLDKRFNSDSYGGKAKAHIYTEALYYYGRREHSQYWHRTLARYGKVIKNGKLDKSLYCSLYGQSVPKDKSWMNFHYADIQVAGIRNSFEFDKLYPELAAYVGEMIEMVRMNNDVIQGFSAMSGPLFKLDPEWMKNLNPENIKENSFSRMFRKTCSPIFVCADLHSNHNWVAGKKLETRIHYFNETRRILRNTVLRISIISKRGKTAYAKEINIGTIKSDVHIHKPLTITVPGGLATGNYLLTLRLESRNVLLSGNSYPIFVLNQKSARSQIKTNRKIAVIANPEQAKQFDPGLVLKKLGVRYTQLKSSKDISKFDVVVIARNAKVDTSVMQSYLSAGGKVVCLSQKNDIKWIPGLKLQNVGAYHYIRSRYGKDAVIGIRSDVIEPKHPVLAGISHVNNWLQWNAAYGKIFTELAFPLSEGVIVSGATSGRNTSGGDMTLIRMGMLIAEIKVGKGIVFLSQVEAMPLYGVDSVATKYINNLFKYTLSDKWNGAHAASLRK